MKIILSSDVLMKCDDAIFHRSTILKNNQIRGAALNNAPSSLIRIENAETHIYSIMK